MARYNTVSVSRIITSATTITTPAQGLFTEFAGTAPYTVILPDPRLYYGSTQRFYNSTSGVITISTPSGVFKGLESSTAATQTIPALGTVELASDGTNYVVFAETGGPLVASTTSITGAITANTTTNNQTFSTSSTGTISLSSGTTGAIDNMTIGVTTRAAGKFTTLDANSTVGISGTSTLSGTTNITGVLSATTGTNNQTHSTTGAGVISISSGTTGAIDNMTIGVTTRAAGKFTSLDANSTVSISGNTTFTGTVSVPIPTADGHAASRMYIDYRPVWVTAAAIPNYTATTGVYSITLNATSLSTVTYTLASGTLPSGGTLNSSTGVISGTSTAGYGTTTNYTFTITATANIVTYDRTFSVNIIIPLPTGQSLYSGSSSNTNGGSTGYTWVAPSGVTTVSVVAIGAGGGGYYSWAVCGGAGGGLVWANGVPVTPGSSYTIQVGNGGCWSGTQGGFSCFPNLIAGGGACGCCPGCYGLGGPYTSGCGSCGMPAFNSTAGGGGGGGGYCNNNGQIVTSGYSGCYGGGGSATSFHSSTHGTGGGGGTGIYGQGSNGACGSSSPGGHGTSGGAGQGGSGGTCGKNGEPYSNPYGNGFACGGNYGGGGGGGGTSTGGGWGGHGGVRIIWGPNRSFPSTNTQDL